MTFEELVAEVITITKRPDLQDRINSAIRAATLKVHQRDYYFRDIKETGLAFASPAYLQSFSPKDIYANYRKIKYLRFHSGTEGDAPGKFYEYIQIGNSNNEFGEIKSDCFYSAGDLIQVRSSVPLQYALFGCYVHPIVTPALAYRSWIADEYPWTIIYEAARIVFRGIGFEEQSSGMDKLGQEQYQVMMASVGTDEVPT